ncbi:hypothetical protein Tco_1086578 [Tanacetum coccineum]
MTTPRSLVTSRAGIFVLFIILPDYKDENITLLVRSAPLPPLPLFEEMEHDLGIPQDDIGSSQQEIVALRARVETLEQSQTYKILRTEMIEQEVEALRARAEAAKQQAKALHISSMPPKEQPLTQGDIETLIDQRVANASEAIAIYETKSRMVHDLMNQVVCQGAKVTKDASNKRKLGGDHDRSSSKQQNKGHKSIRAHAVRPSNKKEYAGTLLLCNKSKFHHIGKPRHYNSDCPKWKNQNHVNQIWKGKALGNSSIMADNVNA